MEAHYLKYPPDRGIYDVYALEENGVGYSAPHYHEHAEIMYVVEGKVQVDFDYKRIVLSKGDAILLFPNQIHRFSEPWGRVKTYIFIFKSFVCPNFKQMMEDKRPEDPVIRSACSILNVTEIMRLLLNERAARNVYSDQIMIGAIQSLLGILLRECNLVNRGSLDETTGMRILNYCHEHFREDINLIGAAEALSLSPYYLSHLIPQKYGLRFGELIAILRLEEAARRIKDGEKISSAALYAGFANVRAFNRAFKKQYGAPPTEYLVLKPKNAELSDESSN